jgi:hypothetical protein
LSNDRLILGAQQNCHTSKESGLATQLQMSYATIDDGPPQLFLSYLLAALRGGLQMPALLKKQMKEYRVRRAQLDDDPVNIQYLYDEEVGSFYRIYTI